MHKLAEGSIRVCVYGAAPCAAAWLDGVRAQLPPGAELVLFGACAELATSAPAVRLADATGDDPFVALAAAARAFPGKHLVLLRADTALPPLAIERLLRALAGADVLVASALDNRDPARSPLPAGAASDAEPARIDAICYAHSARRLIEGNAADALASAWHGEHLAHLDPTVLRDPATWQARGWRAVLLDHLYVAAPGMPLHGPPADADPRDPAPPSALAELRAQVAAALVPAATPGRCGLDDKPVLLHVLHGWGGGAERWVRDFAAAFGAAHHLVLIARGSHARKRHGEWLELHDGAFAGPPLRRVALPQPIADTALADAAYARILEEWIRAYCVDAVIVSSLIGHSLDVLRTGLPTLRVVHDHFPLWPLLHRDFGDRALAFDAAQRAADLAAAGTDFEFAARDPSHWQRLRTAYVASMRAANAALVAPSRSALANELRLAPEFRELPQHVIGHGLTPWPAAAPRAPQPPPRERLRLIVPGRVRRGKGAELLAAALPGLREHAEIFLLGAGADAHAFFGERDVHVLLDYRRDELPALIARLAPDAALLLPTVAETFGYTLSELRSLGVPVIASRIGALAERIADGTDGFLVEPSADAIIARVAALAADRVALARARAALTDAHEPSPAETAEAYARVLRLGARPALRYPLAEIDAAAMHAAALDTALDRRGAELGATRAQLAEARTESARRGDWGHALDRELTNLRSEFDERTRWALALDAELQDIKPRYEQMLASTSWRITAPLRTANARLRSLRARLHFRRMQFANLVARVRGSLAQRGLRGTLARIRQEFHSGVAPTARRTFSPPSETFTPFSVPTRANPRVSIVIPVHDKIAYTAACLRSLAEHAGEIPFEVIVVDDASTDATPARLVEIGGIRTIRNAANLGFVGSCNAGAAAALGDFVLFLNNDTVVTAGWLEALLRCFYEEPDCGLAGAKLVYPDGRLQEAGGIVFNDGSGWNYGRFEDPEDPRFNFRREADYCSGAAILLRRDLLARLGGFDARYAPAYYEDTDLAFTVRAAGQKVYYEPAATVVHFEGVTAGTDTTNGVKRYQVVNRDKFLAKWKDTLAGQPAPGTPIGLAATHRTRKRVLIVDAVTPTPDQDSGSLRMVNLMRLLHSLGCQVSFMADNRAWDARYTRALQALGVEALYHPFVSDPIAFFRARGAEFDAVILSRHYVAASYVGLTRLYAPQAKLIFDTVDLHYLREQRGAELDGKPDLARRAAATRAQELKLMRECDLTLVVSETERELLVRDAPGVRIEVLSNVHAVYGCRRPHGERRDLVFVGGFQHPPNVDAVVWFVREAFPRVRAELADAKFHVIGSKAPREIEALADEHVLVQGHIEDLAPYMDGCRISVAPLRYGAGVKGKVNMAMSYGLPVVATPIAIEGLHVVAGEDVLVAADAAAFAAAVLRLYRDEVLWNRLSANGLANVARHFSFDAARTALRRVLDF